MSEFGVLISQDADGSLLLRRPDGAQLALTAQEAALIRALPPFPDLQSTFACELSSQPILAELKAIRALLRRSVEDGAVICLSELAQ